MRVVVWAAVLSACWRGREPDPATSPIENTASPGAPIAHRSERWVGVGRQFDDNSTWDMVLTLDPSAQVGDDLGTINYPGLSCSGRVVREPDDGDALVGRERITEDPDHHCIDGGAMVIPRARGATFEWRWRHPTGEDGAEATLSRD